MSDRILTPSQTELAANAFYLMSKDALQRDIGRLERFRQLNANFGASLSSPGAQRARQVEAELVQSVIGSSATFVQAAKALEQLAH